MFNSKNEKTKKTEEEIFKETENDFQKLAKLFEDDWINELEQDIINECYKVIKEMNENQIKEELSCINTLLKLQINKDSIIKAQNELIIYSKKEELFSIIILIYLVYLQFILDL